MPDKNYIITTDSTTDLPPDFYSRHRLPYLSVDYILDDIRYDGVNLSLSPEQFYSRMRAGAMPLTQQANPDTSKRFFEHYLKDGHDILHIAFSSGLSGTYQSACIARDDLAERYPDRKLIVIDSLCASLGEGLLVSEALRRQQAGLSIDEVARWVTDRRLNLMHDVVADDLFHLQRGGRVSRTAAVVGTALGIKPMIYLDNSGKLTPYGKVRGKKAALALLADHLARKIDRNCDCNVIYICHSDALGDAQELEQMIRAKQVGIDNFLIYYIGPTIGAHTGIGTVSVFYFAANRDPK
ncbi:MAG: DegV family protein [Angelakisella sp.]